MSNSHGSYVHDSLNSCHFRKTVKKKKKKKKDSNVTNLFCCWRSAFSENQVETNDGVSRYQNLSVSKGDNIYQTLTLK